MIFGSHAAILAAIFLAFAMASPKVALADQFADSPTQPSNTRPHLVIYIADELPILSDKLHSLPQLSQVEQAGLTFSDVYAGAPDPSCSRQFLYRGEFPAVVQVDSKVDQATAEAEAEVNALQADDKHLQRTLTAHLKSLGYRLLLVGSQPAIVGNHFPLEQIATWEQWSQSSSSASGTESATAFNLQAKLQELTAHDQRPICLIIHDRGEHAASAESNASSQMHASESNVAQRIGIAFDAREQVLGAEETLFVVTATRGVSVGDEPHTLADSRLRVPLIMVWPKLIQAGVQTDALVSAVDLLPTIVELAGGTPPSQIDGCSFAGIVRGEEYEHRDLVFAVASKKETPTGDVAAESVPCKCVTPAVEGDATNTEEIPWEVCCVRDRRFKLVRYWSKSSDNTEVIREEFYDLVSDPSEANNLLGQPAFDGRQHEYRNQLSVWLQRHGIRATIGLPGRLGGNSRMGRPHRPSLPFAR